MIGWQGFAFTLMKNPHLTFADVGSPRLSGHARSTTDTLTLTAGGADIWEARDEFHFAYTPVAGDFEFTARIDSLGMADVYTKAGLMGRASLEADAAHVCFFSFGDNQPRNNNNGGIEFQSRPEDGGTCAATYPPLPLSAEPDFPVEFPNAWLQLARQGDTFICRFSQDGVHWKTYTKHQQALPVSLLVGLAVTSHHVDQRVKVVFSQLALQVA